MDIGRVVSVHHAEPVESPVPHERGAAVEEQATEPTAEPAPAQGGR